MENQIKMDARKSPAALFVIRKQIVRLHKKGAGPMAMKAQASAMLESAYQYASGIAAEAGVGDEYQTAVAPVMSQGRAAISSIPDQQTVSVPVGSAQGGGYSSETMDQLGKTFAEQGPCSAGLQLEALKNQNRNR